MATTRTFYDVIRSAPKGRFAGIKRNYTIEDVVKLRSSVHIEHTLATRGANRLWETLKTDPYVNALGALSGNQAMQMVRGGLKAIYLSGWQVAADNNIAGAMYPDQSLYPSNSGPELCRRINKTLQRCDQIEQADGGVRRDWFVPIVADAEAGFGGPLNCFEIMKAYIEAGAAGVHFEDQLAAEKKCGHLGGKVLIPTQAHERNLNAARLAADTCGVPTVLISRTDAESAKLITSDIDERDHEFIDVERGRTAEGFYRLKAGTGLAHCIRRGLSAAPYSDLLWWETSTPDLQMAKEFSEAILSEYPDKMMAYNCSPSFNWEANLTKDQIAQFQKEIGAMGYKFQFVTLAGFHAINYSMFQLALDYKDRGMAAYSRMQQAEFALARYGYTAINHQHEVGTGFFDQVALAAGGGSTSTTAMGESTESAQFHKKVEENRALGKPISSEHAQEKVPLSYANRPVGTSYDPFHVRPARSMHTSARNHAKQGGTIDTGSIDGLRLTMAKKDGDEKILSKEAMEFLISLHQKFEPRRQTVLNARKERQTRIDAGQDVPNFQRDTAKVSI
jgi:isocitrate lyase